MIQTDLNHCTSLADRGSAFLSESPLVEVIQENIKKHLQASNEFGDAPRSFTSELLVLAKTR